MRITIVGTGYVGLVSGACLAELGHEVTCVDKDLNKISALEKGIIPIYEPGLDTLVIKNHQAERLFFSTDLITTAPDADAVFIAVGTPPDGIEGGADLSYVYGVANELAPVLTDGALIVTKSTVPVGSGDRIRDIIEAQRPELEFSIASNPEFLREGCAVQDFLDPDRVIVGTNDDIGKNRMRAVYKPFIDRGVDVFFTDIRTAELAKYAANAFLATKIAFINEISDICESVKADIEQVALCIGTDHRIGRNYLMPGPGFGGSCFPKDTLALNKISKDAGSPSRIVRSVIDSNEQRKKRMAQKIIAACGGDVDGKIIAILGLAFKANTDDMRHSPALVIIPELIKAGASIRVYDPQAMEQAKLDLESTDAITWCKDPYDAMKNADISTILTEWDAFRTLEPEKIKSAMNGHTIVDLRNLYGKNHMRNYGLTYISIGRP